MKNGLIILLFAAATFGFWHLASAYIVAPLWNSGEGQRLYFGLVIVPDLIEVVLVSVWAFLAAHLSRRLVTGRAASGSA